MAATKDTGNNRIQLNEGTRASPKTLAQIVTDINDATWIESLNGGATVVVKRSIWFNGFWLEYANFVSVIFADACHPLMHTSGSGVIYRPYARWSTSQTAAELQSGPQALRDGTTFVMEVDKDGSKPHIRSYGNRYDLPTTFLISGTTYARPKYEIAGATASGTPNPSISNFCKLLGTADSNFSGMTFVGDHMFEVFPLNTYTDFRSTSAAPSYINAGSSGTVVLNRWRINQASNYALGGWVDFTFAVTAQIDDLANDGVGVWNGTFSYSSSPANITTILRHSVRYTFATGTVPISGVKVAIVNTATVGTAQAQTVLTTNGTGVASGFAVRAQGVGNTVSLRQQQRIFARALTHDVPHVQLTLQELTAPVVSTAQGVLNSLYGASEVVSGGVLTKCAFNYTTKTITVSQTMPASELFDSARWSLYQDTNISQPDFTAASTTAVRSFGDWTIVLTNGATVTGSYTDANSSGEIRVQLTSLTDTVQMRRTSDNSLLSSRTGAGGFAVAPSLVGVSVYFERKTGSALVMSTITTPVTLTAGVNPDVPLFAGAEVQVAQAGRIEILPTLSEMTAGGIALQSTLTTLASTNQTEHDATQAAITAIPAAPSAATITSAVRADLERTGGMLDVLPTLAEMEGSAKLSNGGIIDLGVFTSYEGTAGIPYNAYSATFPKRLGLSYGTGLTARLYSEGQGFSSAAQVTDSDTNNNYLNVNIQNVNDFGNYIDSAPILIIFNGTTVNSPIVAKGVFIPGGPSLRDMEQSTVLAKEATVASRASQSSVTALGSPLQSSSYVAPDNTSIAAIKTKTDTLVNGPTLAQIEGSTVLAKATAVSAIPTNPLLATDVRLNNLDATVSSRLASSAYVAAPTLSSIRADIERTGGMLDAVPTLAEIEASAVLAKQSGFTGLATTANVTAAQTAIVAEVNQNETKIDAVKADTAAIKAKTDTLVTAPTAAQIRTELEMVGGKLDTTLKTAKKVRIQTL